MLTTGMILSNKVQLVCGICFHDFGWDGENQNDIDNWQFCPYCGEPLYT